MNAAASRSQYLKDQVMSATPARLLTMLYDRLLLDLKRAEDAQVRGDWAAASEQLVHAQAIITELQTSLNRKVWDGAEGLFAVYTYVANALVNANITRDVNLTREAITMMEPLRQSWHEAAAAMGPGSTGAMGVA
ncbi:MAG: flagellar export chaperone FliS [Arthrobacter sp.]